MVLHSGEERGGTEGRAGRGNYLWDVNLKKKSIVSQSYLVRGEISDMLNFHDEFLFEYFYYIFII